MNKSEITFKNVIAYFQGNFRYKLYYSRFKWLIPVHIRQQIRMRIQVMDRECYNNGSCKICGCKTTALQMANKSCAGNCYPAMMSESEWGFLIKYTILAVKKKKWQVNMVVVFKELVNHPEYFDLDVTTKAGKREKTKILDKIVENG